MNKFQKWEHFRAKAIEAYETIPTSGTKEDLHQAFKNVPDIPGEIYSYALGEAIPIECNDPKERWEEMKTSLTMALRKRFGMAQEQGHANYIGLFSDNSPLMFSDISFGKKTNTRVRFHFYLNEKIRNETLLIYPRAILYHEKIRSRYFWQIAIPTIVGTYFFPPLPFLMLGIRGCFFLANLNVKKMSPRDVEARNATPGTNLEGFALLPDYAKEWRDEILADIDWAIQEVLKESQSLPQSVERRASPSGASPTGE